MSSESVVELDGVVKRFAGKSAVDEVDLSVPRGSMFGFIGPNGSGKTTTMRLILRIYQPDHGRVNVLGRDGGSAADDRVGYLPEERGLYRRMTVRRVLRYFARLKGMKDIDRVIDQQLERNGRDPVEQDEGRAIVQRHGSEDPVHRGYDCQARVDHFGRTL